MSCSRSSQSINQHVPVNSTSALLLWKSTPGECNHHRECDAVPLSASRVHRESCYLNLLGFFLILRTEMILRHLSSNTNTNPGRVSSLIYKRPSKGDVLHFPVVALASFKKHSQPTYHKTFGSKQGRWCDSTALFFFGPTWCQDTGAAILWWGNNLWPDHWVQELRCKWYKSFLNISWTAAFEENTPKQAPRLCPSQPMWGAAQPPWWAPTCLSNSYLESQSFTQ